MPLPGDVTIVFVNPGCSLQLPLRCSSSIYGYVDFLSLEHDDVYTSGSGHSPKRFVDSFVGTTKVTHGPIYTSSGSHLATGWGDLQVDLLWGHPHPRYIF